jgi:urea transport system permease protein
MMLAFFRNDMGFGGNNGLTDFKDIFGIDLQKAPTRNTFFVASVVALALAYAICRAIVMSKLGKVLIAVRDAESRTRFLGYRVEQYKLFVWVVSRALPESRALFTCRKSESSIRANSHRPLRSRR